MKHIRRIIAVVVPIVIAAAGAIAVDPSFRGYVAAHPWAATYLPLAAGIVKAFHMAITDRNNAADSKRSAGV